MTKIVFIFKQMQLKQGINIIDLALHLPEQNTLVLADLHLGYEEHLRKQGFMVPWFQYEKIKARLAKIFKQTGHLEKIIINGDLKHEFGRIPQQEWEEVLGLIVFLREHCDELILIKGNHDVTLGSVAIKKKIEPTSPGLLIGNIYITHGHKIPENEKIKKAKTVIIGHQHPAIGITDGITTETYKCFLKGRWSRKDIIVQPSFCLVTEGIDILKDGVFSPFLKQKINTFDVYVVADEIMYFGKVKAITAD